MTTQTRQNNDTALPAHELGIYMEEDWKMNKRIRLNAGVHLGLYTIDGKTYTSLEPRFSSRFLINPQLSLKASYTRMSQYVHQVNESYHQPAHRHMDTGQPQAETDAERPTGM